MKENIIAGLDIGSTAIRLVVGQKISKETGNELQIIGAIEAPAVGIKKGVVNSIEEATSSISACLEKAERLIGIPIQSVWAGINGLNFKCERSRGVVAVGRSDNEITEDDVSRVIEAAQALSVPPNYEILHVIPVKFTIDNQENIKDPIGMTGVRLEVETLIIQGLSTYVKNMTKAVYRTGLDIDDLIMSPLAAAEVVINQKQKELGSALINIGASTTSLAIFEEDELMHAAVLPIGSDHITSDIAIGLRCPINLAERIKIELGSADPEKFGKKDEMDIRELAKEEGVEGEISAISKKYLSEIIEARVEEIFEKVDNEFKKAERSGMLPAGVFIVGNGAKLNGLITVAKKKLRLPACIGTNKSIMTVIDKVNDPGFITALGLAVWGSKASERYKGSAKMNWPNSSTVGKSMEKVKKWFSTLMP